MVNHLIVDKIKEYEPGDDLEVKVAVKDVVKSIEENHRVITGCYLSDDGFLIVRLNEGELLKQQRYYRQAQWGKVNQVKDKRKYRMKIEYKEPLFDAEVYALDEDQKQRIIDDLRSGSLRIKLQNDDGLLGINILRLCHLLITDRKEGFKVFEQDFS